MTPAQVRKLMRADLKRSGLTERDLYVRPSLVDLNGKRAPGYFIDYPDPHTGKPTTFLRYRYLEKDRKPKYHQLPVPPRAYFSRKIRWAKDQTKVLLVTEGEKKAEAACNHDFKTLGLGGVWNFKSKDKELIDDLEAFDWQNYMVYVVYDSDAAKNEQVRRAENELASLLVKRKAKVCVVRLPELTPGEKTGLDDYLLAKSKEELCLLLEAAEEWQGHRIFRTDPLYRAVEKTELLLAMNPEHRLFLRGGELVRVVEEERTFEEQDVFRRPRGNAYLASMTAANVEFLLSAANCVFAPDGKKGIKRAEPKGAWCAQVIQRISGFPEKVPWLRLQLVTNAPVLLADGSLLDQPGYDEGTGVWFDPQGRTFPPIPARPTKRDAQRALASFSRIFGEFPFAKEQTWDKSPAYATVLATILGVLLRNLLPTVPMLGITAPEPGSGKTKIAEAIGGATTGCLPPRMTYDNQDEFDKHLPVPLKAGDRIVLIDNVDGEYVTSPRLSIVLSTDATIKWRILGETREQAILNRSVFIATGNHLVISGDLPRRSLLCRLDPNVAAPETRKFDFDPVARALAMFPELAMATLTAARYYLQAKCPAPKYPSNIAVESGSFTEWNRVVRGLLVHLDFGDPLATQAEVRSENPFLENDIELARSLYKLFPRGDKFSTSSINRAELSDARALLIGSDKKWEPQKVGFRLLRLRDRVLDGLKVERVGALHGVALYRVLKVKP